MLVTCSQMLIIKNKATQLLMVKYLRPLKHYFLSDKGYEGHTFITLQYKHEYK
jgi:hypothetical protein